MYRQQVAEMYSQKYMFSIRWLIANPSAQKITECKYKTYMRLIAVAFVAK